ncbi:MAG: hypothetical protein LBH76_03290 [Propionibacteriaceae bacterium]|jgi:hypothetical protein|nr:hypothetical protein [Propionibacteriaceae bacterium]
MRRAAPILLAAAALAAFALGGCAQGAASPTVAAEVDGTVVTEADLTAATEAFNAVMAANGVPTGTPANVLSMAVRGVVAEKAEAAVGLSVTETDVSDRLNALGQALFTNPTTKNLVVGTIKLQLLQELVQGKTAETTAFISVLVETDVKVNPRYGSWYVDQLAVADQTGVLASPLTQ